MKQFFAIALVAASLFAATGHADTTQQQSYLAPGGVNGSGLTATIAGNAIGGVAFAANGEVPTHVTVNDDSGAAVWINVCQDIDGSATCDAGEPTATGCGSVDLVGFVSDVDVTVFVSATSSSALNLVLEGGNCAGPATSGVVELTTATAA